MNHLNHSLVRNILLFQLTELGPSCCNDKKLEKIATELKQCWTKKFQRNEGTSKAICLTNYSPIYFAIFSNRGAKVNKAQVNRDLSVFMKGGDTQDTLQLQRQQGFHIIPKLLSIFFNHDVSICILYSSWICI